MRTSTYTRIGNLMALFTERYTSSRCARQNASMRLRRRPGPPNQGSLPVPAQERGEVGRIGVFPEHASNRHPRGPDQAFAEQERYGALTFHTLPMIPNHLGKPP